MAVIRYRFAGGGGGYSQHFPRFSSRISLERENKIYFNGEEITGKIFITPNSDISIYEIGVSIIGIAKINFTKYEIPFLEETEILNISKTLARGKENRERKLIKLPIETNRETEFYFSLKIPEEGFPISYKDIIGEISYSIVGLIIKASPDIKQGGFDTESIILKHRNEICQFGKTITMIKSEGGFFKSHSLKFSFKIGKSIFFTRENIPFKLQIKNLDENSEAFFKIEIVQRFYYKAESETKKPFRIVEKIEKNTANPVIEDYLNGKYCSIPSSYGHRITAMNVNYFILIQVRNNSKIVKGEIPIKFVSGNSEESSNYALTPSSDIENMTAASSMYSINSSIPAYSELSIAETLPPSYDEAINPN